ncbi:hypothetical protein WEN_02615 [Mycoplasma wenyonii str. Massachusetts]|uniref:Uncharacterized protein n=1 Tax=Mycoplasma wenyonii (strain Massachusetts) TaxID=1197325 RepID=I6Z6U9_MYCWM|nr:hypothetical protein [Mycoplasma wenyonii]AFN65308.1 hypothetical protein WEN_02615 [Mycoplasma wenyonii str. Massachusetts]
MQILESPLLKNRIAIGCIGLLGLSTFSGLIHTSVSSGFSSTLSQLFNRIGSGGSVAPAGPSGTEGKITPIQWVSQQSKDTWNNYITPFAKTAYTWVSEKDKRNSVWEVLKKFGSYGFFKGLMSNLPWIALDWVKVAANGETRSKIFLAWKYSLGFFHWAATNSTFKSFLQYFSFIFAELLFRPKEAIMRFIEKEKRATEGCESNTRRVMRDGKISICISVKNEEA